MVRSTKRWGWVMLVLVAFLTFAGAAPAAADDLGSRSSSWLTRLFDWAGWTIDPDGSTAANGGGFLSGLVSLWESEGAGLDPYGNPVPAAPTEEGAGLDPYGTSRR